MRGQVLSDFRHPAGTVGDADGARTARLFIPAGTTACMVLADGGIQPLTRMTLRATEYTVGSNGLDTMPATLPPTSAYT